MKYTFNKRGQFGVIIQAVFTVIILITVIVVLTGKFEKFPKLNEVPAKLNSVQTDALVFEAYTKGIISQSLKEVEILFTDASNRSNKGVFGDFQVSGCLVNKTFVIQPACENKLRNTYSAQLAAYVSEDIIDANVDVKLLRAASPTNGYVYTVKTTFFSPLKVLEVKDTFVRTGFLNIVEDQTYVKREDFSFNLLPNSQAPYAYRFKKDFSFDFSLGDDASFILELENSYGTFQKETLTYLLEKKNSFPTQTIWDEQLFKVDNVTGIKTPTQANYIYTTEIKDILDRTQPILKDVTYTVELELTKINIVLSDADIRIVINY